MTSRRFIGRRSLKPIGRTSIGRRILSSEPFDARAEDGDGDGMVQDGSRWQRPAPKRAARAIRSIARRVTGRDEFTQTDSDGKPKSKLQAALKSPFAFLSSEFKYYKKAKRPMQPDLNEYNAFQNKVESTLVNKFGSERMQRFAVDPNYMLQLLERYYLNAKINHDFNQRGYSPIDAAQAKILLYKSVTDPKTALHLKEISWAFNPFTTEAQHGTTVNGSYMFDIEKGGGVLRLARLGHYTNIRNDDDSKLLDKSLADLEDAATFNETWSPINKVIKEKFEAAAASLNWDDVTDALQTKVTATALHEWGHASHTRSIFETEFGVMDRDWSGSKGVLRKKLFDKLDNSEKAIILEQAIFTETLTQQLYAILDTVNDEETKDEMFAKFSHFITVWRHTDSWAKNIDESTGIKEALNRELQLAINDLQSYLNDIPNAPKVNVNDLLEKAMQGANYIIDNESTKNIKEMQDAIVKYMGYRLPEATQLREDLTSALALQIRSLLDQKILDSLSDEAKGALVDQLAEISDYARMYKTFTEINNSRPNPIGFFELMTNPGGWSAASAKTAIMEGIAELYLATELGVKPSFDEMQQMLDVLLRKEAKMERSRVKTITYKQYLELAKIHDKPRSNKFLTDISACNWLNLDGPVSVQQPKPSNESKTPKQ